MFDNACLDKVNFNLRRTFSCFNADVAMFSICTVQFPSDANITPTCLRLSKSSTDSSLNRMFNSGILVLFYIIRALFFTGLKLTSHVFPIDPIFVNHYLSQFALNQNFAQSMTMKYRQQTVSPICLGYL